MYVKNMHQPKISQKKKEEMERLRESIKFAGRKSQMKKDDDAKSKTTEGAGSVERKKIIWKDNPLKPKPIQKKEPIITDYLKEMRVKKNQDLENSDT